MKRTSVERAIDGHRDPLTSARQQRALDIAVFYLTKIAEMNISKESLEAERALRDIEEQFTT